MRHPISVRNSTIDAVQAMSKLERTMVGRVRSPNSDCPTYRNWYGASTSWALRTRNNSGFYNRKSFSIWSEQKKTVRWEKCKPLDLVHANWDRFRDHGIVPVRYQRCRRALSVGAANARRPSQLSIPAANILDSELCSFEGPVKGYPWQLVQLHLVRPLSMFFLPIH